jgi:cyanophycinase
MSLVLFGSGEFTDKVNDIDKYLISKYKPRNVAVIPAAAGQESDVEKWINMATAHYSKFNLPVIPVEIFNKTQANDKHLVNLVTAADWIFFSGGSPNYLIETLRGSLLWDEVIEKYNQGTLLSGSSAGAMVMGKYILSPSFKTIFGRDRVMWQEAFDLVDYTIIPHFDYFKRQSGFVNKLVSRSLAKIKSPWMGIDENTAIVFDGKDKKVYGVGSVEVHDKNGTNYLKP